MKHWRRRSQLGQQFQQLCGAANRQCNDAGPLDPQIVGSAIQRPMEVGQRRRAAAAPRCLRRGRALAVRTLGFGAKGQAALRAG